MFVPVSVISSLLCSLFSGSYRWEAGVSHRFFYYHFFIFSSHGLHDWFEDSVRVLFEFEWEDKNATTIHYYSCSYLISMPRFKMSKWITTQTSVIAYLKYLSYNFNELSNWQGGSVATCSLFNVKLVVLSQQGGAWWLVFCNVSFSFLFFVTFSSFLVALFFYLFIIYFFSTKKINVLVATFWPG